MQQLEREHPLPLCTEVATIQRRRNFGEKPRDKISGNIFLSKFITPDEVI
jgi:hypothetical protein